MVMTSPGLRRGSALAEYGSDVLALRLYRHDLLFLLLADGLDLLIEARGDLIELFEQMELLVLSDPLLLLSLEDLALYFVAHAPDADPRVFEPIPHQLDQVLSRFLGEGRDHDADQLALHDRIQPDLRVDDAA